MKFETLWVLYIGCYVLCQKKIKLSQSLAVPVNGPLQLTYTLFTLISCVRSSLSEIVIYQERKECWQQREHLPDASYDDILTFFEFSIFTNFASVTYSSPH